MQGCGSRQWWARSNLDTVLLSVGLVAVGIELGKDDLGEGLLQLGCSLGVVGGQLLAVACARVSTSEEASIRNL